MLFNDVAKLQIFLKTLKIKILPSVRKEVFKVSKSVSKLIEVLNFVKECIVVGADTVVSKKK